MATTSESQKPPVPPHLMDHAARQAFRNRPPASHPDPPPPRTPVGNPPQPPSPGTPFRYSSFPVFQDSSIGQSPCLPPGSPRVQFPSPPSPGSPMRNSSFPQFADSPVRQSPSPPSPGSPIAYSPSPSSPGSPMMHSPQPETPGSPFRYSPKSPTYSSPVDESNFPPIPSPDYSPIHPLSTPPADYSMRQKPPTPRVNLAPLIGRDFGELPPLHPDAAGGMPVQEDPTSPPCPDYFFNTHKVLSLNDTNFTSFLASMDASMVMFYSDRYPESFDVKHVFSEAADNTKRENHAFAAVDCAANPSLCQANKAYPLPLIRLYSRNFCIGQFRSLKTFTADMLRQFVEMAPVVDCSRMTGCNRL